MKGKNISIIPISGVHGVRVEVAVSRGTVEVDLTLKQAIHIMNELATSIQIAAEAREEYLDLVQRDNKIHKDTISELHDRIKAMTPAAVAKGFNAEWM